MEKILRHVFNECSEIWRFYFITRLFGIFLSPQSHHEVWRISDFSPNSSFTVIPQMRTLSHNRSLMHFRISLYLSVLEVSRLIFLQTLFWYKIRVAFLTTQQQYFTPLFSDKNLKSRFYEWQYNYCYDTINLALFFFLIMNKTASNYWLSGVTLVAASGDDGVQSYLARANQVSI